MRLFFRIFYPLFCGLIGWALGATYRAPPLIIETTDRLVIATGDMIRDALRNRAETIDTIIAESGSTVEPLPESVSPDIEVDPVNDTISVTVAPGELPSAPIARDEIILAANGLAPFIQICAKTSIENAPPLDSHANIKPYRQMIDVKGVSMAMMPVRNACLSSGFGRRHGKLHKGVDYYSKTGGMIFAAADGQVLEAEYREDYGFMVLLNHGNGYFTRYAHLAGFTKGVKVGAAVPLGFALGEMGKTAGYNIPKHLHFELLKGNYETPKKSFGLESVDIFSL